MNLKQWQEKFGVKRIDFSKIKPSGKAEQTGDNELICPYCEAVIEYECEETESILKGEAYQCPCCEKWFYASADITVNTYCTPMEDAVLDSKRYIQDTYDHVDKCEELGIDWEDKQYGYVEWSVYADYARPLFENMEKEQDGE